ncbi:MAG: TetR/AcrR family transcriptional regulator [Bacteroides sp.]|nr:TetR/AcrR family transcriptional regulator [Bacteroides sp.]MDD2645412.1 TetR/AcrR family transcriptional regulator [Bacteroides sp.]MDD4054928.1 TetR/AcrR family transcriptional regulator [Bacteroides sp.]MDD4719997.1 TetR/AcrR family transcriptional regulator [Bacteroides sp.]NLI63885.1 TetR/AcrR family transcriptional regulator [Bacteroidales bacterium]
MATSKTREQLIDAARKLFARKGVERTTMNDIAKASKKGRRTLYTYFASKEELFLAVVETELDILIEKMKVVSDKKIPPEKKVIELIYTRLEAVKEVVYRNGTLRANFFRDIWSVEKVRRKFDVEEFKIFQKVLKEGVEQDVFDVDNIELTSALIHYCLKGIEVPYIRGYIGADLDSETLNDNVANIVFGALHKKDIHNNKD